MDINDFVYILEQQSQIGQITNTFISNHLNHYPFWEQIEDKSSNIY